MTTLYQAGSVRKFGEPPTFCLLMMDILGSLNMHNRNKETLIDDLALRGF